MNPAHLRALVLMAASVLTIIVAGIAYADPPLQARDAPRATPGGSTDYQISAVDFVDASTGWVVGVFGSGDYSILHTSNAGRTWAQQLSGAGAARGVFMKFFDPNNGVVGLIRTHAVLFRTSDGGKTWSSKQVLTALHSVQSWSFVDRAHGWMLVGDPIKFVAPADLYRTVDGGETWTNLGPPVSSPETAFGVHFQTRFVGWLDSLSSGPYAYRSLDSGRSWVKVALPPPRGGWPRLAGFYVAAHSTHQTGVIVTVASFITNYNSRGIEPVALDSLDGGQTWSIVSPPRNLGVIGYATAWDWWWIGSGTWSRSVDGGATWDLPQQLRAPAAVPGSLQALDLYHAWFAAATSARPALETTDDGGRQWRSVVLPPITDSARP